MADLKLIIDTTDAPKAISAVRSLENQVGQLAQRFARGSIDQGTYMRGINQLSREYAKLGMGINEARGHLMRYGNAQRQIAVQQTAVARGLNRTGVLTQQAGYQIGDFIVQVQSGTNAFVAFGQQATQVAGTLTLLGGKWIAIGSALGVAIPLLTALGAVWMRTRSEIEDTLDPLERVSQELESLERVDLNLGREFRAVSDEAERFLGLLRDIRQESALSSVREAVGGLVPGLRAIELAQERQFQPGGAGLIAGETGFGALVGMSDEEVRDLMETDRILSRITGTTAPALAQSLAEATEELRRQGLLTEDLQSAINNMVNELGLEEYLYEDITGQLEYQNQLYEDRLESLLEAGRIAQEGYDTRQEMVAQLENEISLYTLMAQFGENSVAVERLRAEQARETYEARVRETTTNEVLIAQVMRYYDAMVQSREEAEEVDRVLREITGVSTDSVVQQIMNIAEALGISTSAAIALRQALPGTSGGGVSGPDAAVAQTQEDFGLQGSIVFNRAYRARSGGGGGGSTRTLAEIIAEREQQLDQERELASLFGENQRLREIQIEIERSYGQALSETERAAIRAASESMLVREQEIEQLERLREMQESLADTISSSFGDAVMSMVDGTKTTSEAFKDMAREIIAELYRIIVVEQMVSSIRNALGGGGGFLSRIMTPVAGILGGRASGGSVMSGSPYLVGESGPEVFYPGRSGTIMNNNLSSSAMSGGQQQVDVRVFVDDNGNFDARVERISTQTVARAAPSIVKRSVGAVVEQTKRGGAVKGALR